MSLKGKLAKIEHEIEVLYNRNPEHPRIATLEAEADELVDELNKVEEAFLAQQREKEKAYREKVSEILRLGEEGNYNELFNKYGHEFINDYHIDGNTVHSSVARDNQNSQWTVEDPDKKVRQLVGWRIYDHYKRAR